MKNEDRIVELLAENLIKSDQLADRFDKLTSVVEKLANTMETQLEKIEVEIIKLNLISAENTRALIKLGDNNDRINRLEKEVFK
jgi:hypothetical protein